ncbi:ribose 5-phosphate isomerase B [Balneolaceae bacterium YR4-1]|uniref:Ribose 5-phosphate isomerase B n=1 Tax=Halalkalibaculum roseum TaxID=2709311 RepID=A0A6M1SVK2_9BACT|nr:ribose 5-phosphate isomerase B [Halalkalibaculum roseum]NGP76990.1 ribose 5-phosphate isomerase B [Halalkalibaculum roseum]
MIIPIASDHAGFEAKEKVKKMLEDMGHMPVDFGTHSEDSVDYPDFAVQVAQKVDEGEHEQGILICGSGQGMCMTANKFKNVRAALVYNEKTAALTRQHNNANLLCLPGRELDEDDLKAILKAWFDSDFEGGRHERRVKKIHSLTENN